MSSVSIYLKALFLLLKSSSLRLTSSSCLPCVKPHRETSLPLKSFSFRSNRCLSFLRYYSLSYSLAYKISDIDSYSWRWYFKCEPQYSLISSPVLAKWLPVPVIILASFANKSCYLETLIILLSSEICMNVLLRPYIVLASSAHFSLISLFTSITS